jgi:hypothetical protein
MNDDEIRELREEIERLLAAALKKDTNHEAELTRRDDLHVAETERRDELHVDEMKWAQHLHDEQIVNLERALDSRDLIGQAKGVIMVTVGCSSDDAFRLLRDQSQHENRKLVHVAAEIVERAQRKRAG